MISESSDTFVGFVTRCSLGGSGATVAIKDVVDLQGFQTKAGSKALDSIIPAAKNALIVDKLLEKDCHIIGKTVLHELAYGVTGLNSWAGTATNHQYPTLIPGGSSSGSAAVVAASLVDFSIGTDTGGSVRVPAACCGVFGLKTTFGRFSREGLVPASSSLDCLGPLTRTGQAMVEALSCMEHTFKVSEKYLNLKIGWLETRAEDAINRHAQKAVTTLSRDISTLSLPLFEEAHQAGLTIMAHEHYQAFSYLLDSGKLGDDIASRLEMASLISDVDLQAAEAVRSEFSKTVDAALQSYDVIALPTLPFMPPTLNQAKDLMKMVEITSLCRPFNLSGHPALALPAGEIGGRPVSLQLVARKGADEILAGAAKQYDTHLNQRMHA